MQVLGLVGMGQFSGGLWIFLSSFTGYCQMWWFVAIWAILSRLATKFCLGQVDLLAAFLATFYIELKIFLKRYRTSSNLVLNQIGTSSKKKSKNVIVKNLLKPVWNWFRPGFKPFFKGLFLAKVWLLLCLISGSTVNRLLWVKNQSFDVLSLSFLWSVSISCFVWKIPIKISKKQGMACSVCGISFKVWTAVLLNYLS